MSIHYNIEAVGSFSNALKARIDALAERIGDERLLYDSVFDEWRDHRAEAVKAQLEELQRTVSSVSSDMDDLNQALAQQMRAAQEYLNANQGY